MITIEEFTKLDLRVATIKAVEPHPNADRLLVLKIDLGTEERQLVASIRAHYTPEELVGKQIVVVANLQPATLRGVESQGMLLAASDGEKVIVLSPEKPVAPGAKIR
ncbi:MAG: methionine--tRNA ligase subunit beta [Deltaproteobacteria bacterium]|nr:methionine--tRNA ligase subunit beta [Deltaproteobacteria bacterium]